MTSPKFSPRLPAFGIRDLFDHSREPSLISITASQYNSTLTSQPDAALRYVDDDDGELVIVGSACELKWKLEEQAKDNTGSTRNPLDGQLVHVFDISRSGGSLAEWRDHEAYSSKYFRPKAQSPSWVAEPQTAQDSFEEQRLAHEEQEATADHFSQVVEPGVRDKGKSSGTQHSEASGSVESLTRERLDERDDAAIIADNIIDSLEFHLNGLAKILQGAANTLQKAATKTRETDTSVVEDILTGVKGIIAEVGSLGSDVFKTLEANTSDASTSTELPLATASGSGESNIRTSVGTRISIGSSSESGDRALNEDDKSSTKMTSRVTFDIDEPDVMSMRSTRSLSVTSPSLHSISSFDLHEGNALDGRAQAFSDCHTDGFPNGKKPSPTNDHMMKPRTESIIDRDTEDLDFAARYPPLQSVRRAQTIGASTQRYQPYIRRTQADEKWTPFMSAPYVADESSRETADGHRPLPGAWPEVKNEALVTLPSSKESSGAFFNRMTGRTRQIDEESAFKPGTSLHRANTTASANPASRLYGPFNPDLPHYFNPSVMDEQVWVPSPTLAGPSSGSKRPKLSLKTSVPVLLKPNICGSDQDIVPSCGVSSTPQLHHAQSVPYLTRASYADEVKRAREQTKPVWAQAAREPPAFRAKSSLIPATPVTADYVTGSSGSSSTTSHSMLHQSVAPVSATSLCTQPSKRKSCQLAEPCDDDEADCASYYDMSNSVLPGTDRDTTNMTYSTGDQDAFGRRRTQRYSSTADRSSPSGAAISRSTTTASSCVDRWVPRSTTAVSPASASSLGDATPKLTSVPMTAFMSTRPATSNNSSSGTLDQVPFFSAGQVFAPPTAFSTPYFSSPPPPPPPTWPSPRHTDVPSDDKIDICVSKLKDLGFGMADPNLHDRLHVYATVSDGEVEEAIDMIEEDRRLSYQFSKANLRRLRSKRSSRDDDF